MWSWKNLTFVLKSMAGTQPQGLEYWSVQGPCPCSALHLPSGWRSLGLRSSTSWREEQTCAWRHRTLPHAQRDLSKTGCSRSSADLRDLRLKFHSQMKVSWEIEISTFITMFNSQFHVGMFIECPKLVEVVLKQCMPVGALQAPHRIHLDGC